MKVCTQCLQSKNLDQFAKRNRSKDGLQYKCKECTQLFNKAHYQANREEICKAVTIYWHQNKEWLAPKLRQTHKVYRENNKGRYAYHCRMRQARLLQATPIWLTSEHKQQMIALYEEGKAKGMHVDHIIPLKGKNVCGLHVPWNLQLLNPSENFRKNNKLSFQEIEPNTVFSKLLFEF